MPLTLMLALQAAAASAPASAPIVLDLDFDLARYDRAQFDLDRGACNRADPSAIVVCARRAGNGYPLEEMERIYGPRRLVAETSLFGNLTGNMHVESAPLLGGAVSNRFMVGLRLPF